MRILHADELQTVPAQPVDLNDLEEVSRISKLLIENCEGVGLHAVQLGINKDIWIMDAWRDKQSPPNFSTYINCTYQPLTIPIDNMAKVIEGCLSLPNELFEVERYLAIQIDGFGFINNKIPHLLSIHRITSGFQELVGHKAIIAQHEIDHGRGITIRDIGYKF